MVKMKFEEKWQRAFTPKRYLHGPFAEYMYTLWADMKLMVGPIVEQTAGYRSSAVKLLVGEELLSPDFEVVKTIPREDGLPLHLLTYETEEYRIVGVTEADPFMGLISDESPIGKALLGKKVNSVVEVEIPIGTVKYKIMKISK